MTQSNTQDMIIIKYIAKKQKRPIFLGLKSSLKRETLAAYWLIWCIKYYILREHFEHTFMGKKYDFMEKIVWR